MTLNETPNANRLHIGFYGKRNAGKSSLINAFTGQEVSIVSEVAGTTTDPVNKAMEIHDIGACVLIDTAGFDDIGELGEIRVQKTKMTADKIDIAYSAHQTSHVFEANVGYDFGPHALNWYTNFAGNDGVN